MSLGSATVGSREVGTNLASRVSGAPDHCRAPPNDSISPFLLAASSTLFIFFYHIFCVKMNVSVFLLATPSGFFFFSCYNFFLSPCSAFCHLFLLPLLFFLASAVARCHTHTYTHTHTLSASLSVSPRVLLVTVDFDKKTNEAISGADVEE